MNIEGDLYVGDKLIATGVIGTFTAGPPAPRPFRFGDILRYRDPTNPRSAVYRYMFIGGPHFSGVIVAAPDTERIGETFDLTAFNGLEVAP